MDLLDIFPVPLELGQVPLAPFGEEAMILMPYEFATKACRASGCKGDAFNLREYDFDIADSHDGGVQIHLTELLREQAAGPVPKAKAKGKAKAKAKLSSDQELSELIQNGFQSYEDLKRRLKTKTGAKNEALRVGPMGIQFERFRDLGECPHGSQLRPKLSQVCRVWLQK